MMRTFKGKIPPSQSRMRTDGNPPAGRLCVIWVTETQGRVVAGGKLPPVPHSWLASLERNGLGGDG